MWRPGVGRIWPSLPPGLGESVCGFVNWGREPAGVQWVGEGEGVRETDRAVLSVLK